MTAVYDSLRPDLGGNLRDGDINTFCPVLWRYLADRFALRSVLDVGCGEGHAVAYFSRLGLFAHGIDGLQTNIDHAVVPIAKHDLLTSAYLMPVDLVWSCEVAEHIREECLPFYLDTMCNGKYVAMTHALPGQDGHHHVNCQPSEYWISHFERRGYKLSKDIDTFRSVAAREAAFTYFQNSGLVFIRS